MMNENLPLVSVVMPTYNNANYIDMAINDIVLQTYSNWELIIVDDGSTDDTAEILLKYQYHPRIKVITLSENQGICKALNKGLEICSGSYILRFDADDRCKNTRIETQLNYLVENNLDLVGSSVVTIDEKGSVIGNSVYVDNYNVIKKTLRYESPVLHIWLAKKNVYDCVGKYRLSGVEDYDFLLRAIDLGFSISNMKYYDGIYIRKHKKNTANVYGWQQRKYFNIAWKLHRERVKYGDEISKICDHDTISSAKIGNKIHSYSNRLLVRAIQSNNIFSKIIFVTISVAISPYQFQYLVYRTISKIIKR
ncbi:glycosyltransferase family 2 protein [Hafnia paralvei]|uniref:glycosyltransferase family 2 protein n=1 Tax=Hafnia paralvei TaxID=546367 RepID=UPI00107BF75E|nr:glycosyltransferase family 2 protein [Hafnia paralvei]